MGSASQDVVWTWQPDGKQYCVRNFFHHSSVNPRPGLARYVTRMLLWVSTIHTFLITGPAVSAALRCGLTAGIAGYQIPRTVWLMKAVSCSTDTESQVERLDKVATRRFQKVLFICAASYLLFRCFGRASFPPSSRFVVVVVLMVVVMSRKR